MRKAFELLKRFVSRVDEADRFDERHLLPIATEVFGSSLFPLHTEYLALPKRRNSHILVTARRMAFESYYSFVLTDFFEGLHHGHYPRQCEICGQYFLMQSARAGRSIVPTAQHRSYTMARKSPAAGTPSFRARQSGRRIIPSKLLTKNAGAAIRSEKSRGTITAEFAAAAQAMAKRRLEQAEEDDAYAKTNYYADLERAKLYADTGKRMK